MNTTQDNDTINHALSHLGWTPYFQAQYDHFSSDGLVPARVVGVNRNYFRTSSGETDCLATLAGKLRHDTGAMYPVTGDWVLMKDKVITRVLVRQNALSRGASGTRGKTEAQPQKEQLLAANLDTVWIVCGLDRDYNLRRIERYLTLVYNCGLTPVVVLTKADLHPEPEAAAGEVETVAFGVPIHLMSISDDSNLVELASYLAPGRTTTLVGSSGAGKSTLVNRLSGKTVQHTRAVSDRVGKGKHTTTSRDLIMMPQGGMVIDNPGIREIAFWEGDDGVASAFPEIDAFARECRFKDCSHIHEPGCRVVAAVAAGEISGTRLDNYLKLKRELAYLSDRRQKSADRVEKERWKGVALKIKAINRAKR